MKYLVRLLVSIFIGLPLAFLLTVVFMPVKWQIENAFQINLTGNSGPSNMMAIGLWILVSLGLFVLSVLGAKFSNKK